MIEITSRIRSTKNHKNLEANNPWQFREFSGLESRIPTSPLGQNVQIGMEETGGNGFVGFHAV